MSTNVPTASASAAVAAASAALASAASASVSAQSVIDTANGATTGATSKIVGVILAVSSGLLIGSSFVFKKKGLLASQKSAETAGEGHAYLKSPMWWTGMTIMILGEICNFVAYAFADAVLVTPLGALSVVVCAILSSIFLKERLSFFGKIGCALCIVGAAIIALNSPAEQSVTTIAAFEKLFLAPGFLVFGSVCIVGAFALVFFVAPKFGKKNMLVYISVCSLIGGLSVANTQALGAAIVTSIKGDSQIKNWFFWFLLIFVIVTLLIEINYLNKALELFNTAMVTPTYYVLFTFCTLVTSVILYQGLKAPVVDIITLVLGFLVICAGITLLQMSKIDPNELKLDRRSTILLSAAKADTEPSEKTATLDIEDPGIDALRGAGGTFGSLYRARSARRSIQSHKSGGSDWRRRYPQMRGEDAPTNVGLNTLTTVGLNSVPRHQLYDRPVAPPPLPDDALEQVTIHSGGTSPISPPYVPGHIPRTSSLDVPPSGLPERPRPKKPTLQFSTDITSHHYPAMGQAGVATHEHHLESPRTPRPPGPPTRQSTGDSTDKKWNAYNEAYTDPYTETLDYYHQRSPREPEPQVRSPSLNAALKASFSAPAHDVELRDPRSDRHRHRTLSGHQQSHLHAGGHHVGSFGELFSPRRAAERREQDRSESTSLVRSPDGHQREFSRDTLPSSESEEDEKSIDGDAV